MISAGKVNKDNVDNALQTSFANAFDFGTWLSWFHRLLGLNSVDLDRRKLNSTLQNTRKTKHGFSILSFRSNLHGTWWKKQTGHLNNAGARSADELNQIDHHRQPSPQTTHELLFPSRQKMNNKVGRKKIGEKKRHRKTVEWKRGTFSGTCRGTAVLSDCVKMEETKKT